MDYFARPGQSPEAHGREAARVAIAHARRASMRPPARWRSCSARATPASSCTRRSATGSRPTSTARRRRTTPARSASRSRRRCARSSTTAPSTTRAASINVDDEGNAGQRNVLIENGIARRATCTTGCRAKHFGVEAVGQRAPRELPARAAAAHDEHLHGAAARTIPRTSSSRVKRGVYAKRFAGGQVNISNGDFVFSLTESYLIEDGKLTAPLKGVNLIGNGPDVLRKVDDARQRLRAVATASGRAARTGSRCPSASARRR